MTQTSEPCAVLIGFQALWTGRDERRAAHRLANPGRAVGKVADIGPATADPAVTEVHLTWDALPGEMFTFRAGELRYRNPKSTDAAFHTLHDLIGIPPLPAAFYFLRVQETHIIEYEYIVRAHTPAEAVERAERGERVESHEVALLDVSAYDPTYDPATFAGVVRIEDPVQLAQLRKRDPDSDENPEDPFQCADCGAISEYTGHHHCPTPGAREESPAPEPSEAGPPYTWRP